MAFPSSVLLQKELLEDEEKEKTFLPLLQLLTFSGVGNPLENMTEQQRRYFFEILMRGQIQQHNTQEMQKNSRLIAKQRLASPLSVLPSAAAASSAHLPKIIPAKKMLDEKKALEEKLSKEAIAAQEKLSLVISDHARADAAKAEATVVELETRLAAQGYKTDDVMATLLLVIEDQTWEGGEGEAGGSHTAGSAIRIRPKVVPLKLRAVAKESSTVRLASVREMLRYYFDRHPKDYVLALAAALGLSDGQEEDAPLLREKIASDLARIGGFAFAQKLLAALKAKKRMDTKKCLLEVGYRYDSKTKKLIVGKRTCGKPAEAKGIVWSLLSAARGKAK